MRNVSGRLQLCEEFPPGLAALGQLCDSQTVMAIINLRNCPACKAKTHQKLNDCLADRFTGRSFWRCLNCGLKTYLEPGSVHAHDDDAPRKGQRVKPPKRVITT